jgi:glycine/serine hydroxymethyltransferase
MGEEEMTRIADLVDLVLTRRDEATVARVRGEVEDLAAGFPLYRYGHRPALAVVR